MISRRRKESGLGTPSHVEYLRRSEDEPRSYRGRCKYYDHVSGMCLYEYRPCQGPGSCIGYSEGKNLAKEMRARIRRDEEERAKIKALAQEEQAKRKAQEKEEKRRQNYYLKGSMPKRVWGRLIVMPDEEYRDLIATFNKKTPSETIRLKSIYPNRQMNFSLTGDNSIHALEYWENIYFISAQSMTKWGRLYRRDKIEYEIVGMHKGKEEREKIRQKVAALPDKFVRASKKNKKRNIILSPTVKKIMGIKD